MYCNLHNKVVQSECQYPQCERERGCELCQQICLQNGHRHHTKVETIEIFFKAKNFNEFDDEPMDYTSVSLKEENLVIGIHVIPPPHPSPGPQINQFLTDIQFPTENPEQVWEQVDLIDEQKEVEEKKQKEHHHEVVNQYDDYMRDLLCVGLIWDGSDFDR